LAGALGSIAHPPESPEGAAAGAMQLPVVSQTFGDAQSLTEPHIVWHAPPAHAKGAQSFRLPAGSTTVCPS
jgi:hypothetical protein